MERPQRPHIVSRLIWFAGLWLAGVCAVTLLSLVIKLALGR